MAESLRQILWRSSVTLVKAVSVCHIVFAYGGFPTQVRGAGIAQGTGRHLSAFSMQSRIMTHALCHTKLPLHTPV